MEQTMKKLTWLAAGIFLVVLALVLITWNKSPSRADGELGSAAAAAVDLIGTKVGTTTSGVAFSVNAKVAGTSATTSYPYLIGQEIDTAVFNIKAVDASSTAKAVFGLAGSNDAECDSATTTTSYTNYVLKQEVNWFPLGDHLKDKVHSTSFINTASSSILVWDNATKYESVSIILEDLAYKCIKLDVAGSSTVLWAQLSTKSY